jgi:hypothetical protein
MSEPKVTTFRFTEEELEVLGMIEGQTGIRSRTEALKGVLREHGVAPVSATPEPGAKPAEASGDEGSSRQSLARGEDAP